MTQTATTADFKIAAPPRANSVAYFVDWVQELAEVRAAGMMSDEDFAIARAERLDSLFDPLPTPWRKWLFFGVPLSLLAGAALAHFDQPLWVGAVVAGLCILAALGTYSHVMAHNLAMPQKLQVLRDLLARDLVSAEQFADFEDRILMAR